MRGRQRNSTRSRHSAMSGFSRPRQNRPHSKHMSLSFLKKNFLMLEDNPSTARLRWRAAGSALVADALCGRGSLRLRVHGESMLPTLWPGEVVEIGGVPIALATSDEGFLDLLRQRYDGFLSSSRPQFELEFDVTSMELASDDDVRVRREGDEWLLQRGDFHARWDPRSGRGSVCQDANPYALDSVLRIVH